jgi:hypothetical protein
MQARAQRGSGMRTPDDVDVQSQPALRYALLKAVDFSECR